MSELIWRFGDRHLDCGERTRVMGVLNVTPDSFSDGGRYFDSETAVAQGIRMAADGADVIDVGGESTRPGAPEVPADEELDRVLPVIRRLSWEVDVPLSIDTRKAKVAAAAVDAGALIVNDVSGGEDPLMFDVVREWRTGYVVMHMRGEPSTMQQLTDYDDVVGDVHQELQARLKSAEEAGIEPDRLCADPGLGFAKTGEQTLLLMRRIDAFQDLGYPVLVGPSRKSFIGHVLDTDTDDRLEGTAGAVAWLAGHGAHIVRVHDVKEMARVARVVDAIRHAGDGGG